jgi:hypothetical protein
LERYNWKCIKSHVLDYVYVSTCKNNSDRIPINLQNFEQRHEFNFFSYHIKYIKIIISITKVKQLDFSYSLVGFSTMYVDRHQLLPS